MAASTNPRSTTATTTYTLFEADTPWGSAASLDGVPLRACVIKATGVGYTIIVSYKKMEAGETASTRTTYVQADSDVPIFAPSTTSCIVKITVAADSTTAGTVSICHSQDCVG